MKSQATGMMQKHSQLLPSPIDGNPNPNPNPTPNLLPSPIDGGVQPF